MVEKYERYLRAQPEQPCPPEHFVRSNRIGFRFMHEPATEADFVPVGLQKAPPKPQCTHFAVSFFTTVLAARKRYASLAERMDVEAKFGSHIGELALVPTDGRMGPPSGHGHFDLHPDAQTELSTRITSYHKAVL